MVDDLFRDQTAQGVPLSAICAAINQKLFERMPINVFMAAAFMEWHETQKTLYVWNCAMPDIVVLRDGTHLTSFISGQLPLGINHTMEFPYQYCFQANTDDRMIACSDGIIETHNVDRTAMFGMDGLMQVLLSQSIEQLPEVLDHFRGHQEQADDITLVALQCL